MFVIAYKVDLLRSIPNDLGTMWTGWQHITISQFRDAHRPTTHVFQLGEETPEGMQNQTL